MNNRGRALFGAIFLFAVSGVSADLVPAQPQPGPLLIPVAGVEAGQLFDTFNQMRGGHPHEAIDIAAPQGTAVVAAEDGKIAKLFLSKPGGWTVYQFDPTERLAYYYAHLDRYAPGLAEGQEVKRGEVLGYVGSSGNANPAGPHLHFAIFVLGPEKRWWKGTAINPYPFLRDGSARLPGAHASDVYVHELGKRIEADAAPAQR